MRTVRTETRLEDFMFLIKLYFLTAADLGAAFINITVVIIGKLKYIDIVGKRIRFFCGFILVDRNI